MSILSRLNKWLARHIYKAELTPKGECVRRYVSDIVAGKDVYIQDYEDILDSVRDEYKDMLGREVSREETAELMELYFNETF